MAKTLLENLMVSVKKGNWDEEEKIRVYPQIAILLLHIYDRWEENEKYLFICEETIEILK